MTTTDGLIPIDYRDGDVALRGYLALPPGEGPHPGVLIYHHGLGLGAQAFDRAHRLAALGYAAFACDHYGLGIPDLRPADAMRHSAEQRLNENDGMRARIKAGYDAFAAQAQVDAERLGAIGFCLGGACVLELARMGAEVKAVASYHGVLATRSPAVPGAVKAKVAVFTGSKDPHAPAEHVEALRAEMTAAGADWQVTEYGEGYHAFTGPRDDRLEAMEGLKYDPLLDAMSWAATIAMFDTTLRSGAQPSAAISTPIAIH